ncbi:MAG: p-aminobenzoyl-glutamate transporter, partial [Serratia liquefaciens]|nr:p-aminobenzoyl-glutamate transporter [Serratia liquefaciens]
MSEATTSVNKSPGRIFYWVERIGNKIPNPFLLFVYLIVVLMLSTALFSWLDVAVKNPATGELIKVNNLMSVAGMQWIFPNIIHNFSSFAPLGAILALVIGAGLAEKVGLLQALMYKMASRVSARYASYMVLFIAFFSHISSDAALVVMPPLGALMFLAVGRHPIAGLLAAIAGVASGFTANLLIVTTDVLLSGISTEATKAVDAAVHVSVIDNWYFMATSVIVLTIAGALLTDKFIEPRLPEWRGSAEDKIEALTPLQNRGLMMSGIAALVFIAIIAALVVPEAAPLRDPKTGSVIPSPFIKGIVPIIILFFFTVGITYGVVTKQIRRPDDIPHHLTEPMKSMAGFIVMVFPLSQFVAFFNWSNMGKFMAIGLTDMLEAAGMSGAPAFLGLMFLSAFLCMFIASGSAIWSILAPIFVPMFMLLGFHPAFAQMIFRIADSSVLPLAPMSPFLPLFLGFLQRY